MSDETRRARIGIIGCGAITQNVHIPAIQRLADTIDLVAVCDADGDLARLVAGQYAVTGVYDDHRAMLASQPLDGVVITVGDPLHVPIALDVIAAGKDAFVEKPMGTSVEECLRLRDAVEMSENFVQIGNMRRYDTGVAYARMAVASMIGEVQSFNAWYRSSAGEYFDADGAYLPTLRPPGYRRPAWKLDRAMYALDAHASHLFDHIRYVVGAPQTVRAIRGRRGDHYSWQGLMELGGGGVGRFELTYETSAPWSEGVEVYGTAGSVRLDMASVVELRPSRVEVFDAATRQTIRPLLGEGSMYVNQMRGFAHAVLRRADPLSTVHDGLAVVRDIAATRVSVEQSGGAVALGEEAR